MPLEFRRLNAVGERAPRDVSEKCNQIGEAAGLELDALVARVNTLELAIIELRFAAQGAMRLGTPVAGPDITAAFQPITFYDTIPYERRVTVDTVTGEFTFNVAGDWVVWYRVHIEHATTGARRSFDFRAFNVTPPGTPGPSDTHFVGSNSPDSETSLMIPFVITPAEVGQSFRLEVGNASADLTGVTWASSNLLLMFVGELGSLTIPSP